MRSVREWLDPGGRRLKHWLDQLRDNLETLGAHLREKVAELIGANLGEMVRDTVLHALDRLSVTTPSPASLIERPLYGGRRAVSRYRPNADDADEYELWQEAQATLEEHEYDDDEDDVQPAGPSPQKITVAMTAGLQAAWLLRRFTSQRGLLSLVGVVLLAGFAAYTAPTVVVAGLGLLGSAGQLGYLTNTLQSVRLT